MLQYQNCKKNILTNYIKQEFNLQHKEIFEEKNKLEKEFQAIIKKIERLKERFIDEDITKELFEKFISKLNAEKLVIENQLQKAPEKSSNLENTIQKAIKLSSKINKVWDSADYMSRQKLQYLLFPEGITYNRKNDECRTLRVNSIFLAMAELANVLQKDKPNDSNEKLGL